MAKKEEKVERDFSSFIKEINKTYGQGSAMTEDSKIDIDKVSFGSIGLDIASGGGLGVGKWAEIFGDESSGKTTVAIMLMVEFQKKFPDKAVGIIDFEHAFDINYAKALGLDTTPDRFVISQPDYGEQGYNIANDYIKSGFFSFLVIDSIAAGVPKAIIEGDSEDNSIALQARLISKVCGKLKGISNKNNVSMLWINQTRTNIGVMFGDPTTTAGGKAIKFFVEQRIRLRVSTAKAEIDNDRIKVTAQFIKNKIAPPFGKCEYYLNFGKGLDKARELFELAIELGGIEVKGRTYSYEGATLGSSKDSALEMFRDQVEMQEELRERIIKHYLEEDE